ncbi:MAG: glycosyltransferase, exosortase A system-associated [Rhodospirillaceae bacterium]|nr:glycosyltransferase, exosortase A system-associated [Rhodospirillaceae bacterium]
MRILHVFDHSLPLHSGYTFRSRAILREQRRRGWETFQVTSPRHIAPGPDPEQVDDGLWFSRTRSPNPLWTRLPAGREIAEIVATSRRVVRLIDDVRPDIVHAHSPVLNAMAALIASRRRGIPVVYEIRGLWEDAAVDNGSTRYNSPRYRLSRALETFAARNVDAVGVICRGLQTELQSRGVSPDRMFVVPNAVDLDQFGVEQPRDAALARQLGLEGADVVGFLGSFYDYEGLDVLVEAAAKLIPNRPTLKLLLVGGGPVEQQLRAQIARLGLSQSVIMPGRVKQQEVGRYYSLVDIMAFPRHKSRLTDLVTPLKPLEAMASRKLVIASDVGGHREMVDPGRTGELFPSGDPSALAELLDSMFKKREAWPAYLTSALDYVRRERTWERSIANYDPVYTSLARRKPISDAGGGRP